MLVPDRSGRLRTGRWVKSAGSTHGASRGGSVGPGGGLPSVPAAYQPLGACGMAC